MWTISPTTSEVQSAETRKPFGDPLLVEVRQEGSPVDNGTIRFEITAKDSASFPGNAQYADVQTDQNGRATAPELTAGATPGSFTIQVSVPHYNHTPTSIHVNITSAS